MDNMPKFIDTLAPAKRGDRVLSLVPNDLCNRLAEVHDLGNEVRSLQSRLVKMNELVKAKAIVFWDDMKKLSEQAGTAEDRGMNLGIRKKDGAPVLVEFRPRQEDNQPPCVPPMFFGFSPHPPQEG